MNNISEALENIPQNWFLDELKEIRSRVIYAGDKHLPTGQFRCGLQHERGGMLTHGHGGSADQALAAAIAAVNAALPDYIARGIL